MPILVSLKAIKEKAVALRCTLHRTKSDQVFVRTEEGQSCWDCWESREGFGWPTVDAWLGLLSSAGTLLRDSWCLVFRSYILFGHCKRFSWRLICIAEDIHGHGWSVFGLTIVALMSYVFAKSEKASACPVVYCVLFAVSGEKATKNLFLFSSYCPRQNQQTNIVKDSLWPF